MPPLRALPLWPVGLALALLSWLIGVAWMAPPAVQPLDAPTDTFSGARAVASLTRVLGDERPHPVGTLGNRMVEARIQDELALYATRARVDQGTICAETCARIRNLVVELPGQDPSLPPVLVSTHYDSVASGPGAGDAGAAVGTLIELTRLLRAHPLRRPVHLLFNEGEEAGLLGAQVYLREPREVAAVINLEARGTGGNAFLFELKGAALPWVRRYASQATSPSISSLYTAIYALLPNNTDATIYGNHGLPVANVAFLGGGVRYHTPRDDLAHLEPASVQHLGEQALSLLRALDDGDLTELQGTEPAVFWNAGPWVICAPQQAFRIGVGLLGLAILALVGGSLWAKRFTPQQLAGALGLPLGLVGASGILGAAIEKLAIALGFGWLGVPWVPVLGLLLIPVSLALLAAPLLKRTEPAIWSATALFFALLAGLCAWLLPEGSYLFAQPALALGIAAALPKSPVTTGVQLLLALLAALPLAHLAAGLLPALGLLAPLVAASAALALLPLVPAFCEAPRRSGGAAAGLCALLFLGTALLPDATADRPTGRMIAHLTIGEEAWLQTVPTRFPYTNDVGPVGSPAATPPLRFGRAPLVAQPSSRPPAVLELVERLPTGVRVRVKSSLAQGLYIQGAQVTVDGATAGPFEWVGDPDGLLLDLVPEGPVLVVTIYPGLPEDAVSDEPNVVPIHTGYQTWIGRWTTFAE